MNKFLTPTLTTIDDVLSVFETLGFTVDTTNGTARWANDTNNKLYFAITKPSNAQFQIRMYNSSSTIIYGPFIFSAPYQFFVIYENINNGILFGFTRADNYTGNNIQFAIIPPTSNEDNWLYINAYNGSSGNRIFDGKTEQYINYGITSLYNGSALGAQIVKFYNGMRFVDNLYMTSVCQSIPIGHSTELSTDNFVQATISNENYLIINMTQNATYNKIAIKKSTTP